ncbi:MAG TPA: hypothetical protein VH306_12280 [Gaiellaceae bacterium]
MSSERAATSEIPLLTRCAWCSDYEVGDEWLEESVVHAFVRPGGASTLTHGICPSCVAELRELGLSH